MDTKSTASKGKWTATRLFWLSAVGFLISFVIVVIALLLWWPLAFDWDADKPSIGAYVDGGVFVLGGIAGVLFGGVMVVSGAIAFFSRPAT